MRPGDVTPFVTKAWTIAYPNSWTQPRSSGGISSTSSRRRARFSIIPVMLLASRTTAALPPYALLLACLVLVEGGNGVLLGQCPSHDRLRPVHAGVGLSSVLPRALGLRLHPCGGTVRTGLGLPDGGI